MTVFVGQIATAGLGITLTAADKMVFYSLDYSMSNFEQTKARIHRVGQRNPCTYIYLVADGTVDEKGAQSAARQSRSGESPDRRLPGGQEPVRHTLKGEIWNQTTCSRWRMSCAN